MVEAAKMSLEEVANVLLGVHVGGRLFLYEVVLSSICEMLEKGAIRVVGVGGLGMYPSR